MLGKGRANNKTIIKNMEEITKEEIKKIMEFPGKVRGAAFKGGMEYILEKKGEEGLRAVEKETERLGFPLKYREIKETGWYPAGLGVVSSYAIVATFNWGKKELIDMAEAAPKVSFIVRFFMRYFATPEKIFSTAASRMWERYYNVGSLEAIDFKRTKKDGYAVVRLKNFKLHPFHCFYLGHFFIGVFKLAEPRFKEINFEETKCMFKGNSYHEYLIKWTYK